MGENETHAQRGVAADLGKHRPSYSLASSKPLDYLKERFEAQDRTVRASPLLPGEVLPCR